MRTIPIMQPESINNNIFIIPESHANERLDQALAKLMPDFSRSQIQQAIDAGTILVNGKQAKAKTKMKGGETISFHIAIKPLSEWQAEDIPLHIVYEDEDIIVLNKQAGMVVHPGTGNSGRTMLNALLHHAKELELLPRAGILHRLDKDTSGLLVIAKNAAALKSLTHQLKKRTMSREYQAIIYGRLISGGKVDAPVGRHPTMRKKMAVTESGRTAITHYRVAEKFRAHTLLKLKLETGRTHQIRVHMMHIHHPIVGDVTYGGRVQLTKGMSPELIQTLRRYKRQALHAYALGFTHPRTGKECRFEIELPDDMKQLIQLLKADTASQSK